MNASTPYPYARIARLVCAVTAAAWLSACSDGGADKATQVAAKVGDSEISVHQINQVLQRAPMPNADKNTVQAASQQVLERLIDQQLAVDAATEDKLHRSPDVVASLEAARREVLARAYVQKITNAVTKATPEDVQAYYKENPALFAERRVYNIQEIRVPDARSVIKELDAMAQQGKPIEQVANTLKERKVPYTGGSATRAAEQLPLPLLPTLHKLRDGQSVVVAAGNGATFVRIAGSQSQPVAMERAAPGIAQFLNNRRTNEAVTTEIKRLREATKVSYMGEFSKKTDGAKATSADGATVPSAVESDSATGSGESTKSVTPPTPASSPDQAAMERGLSGLK
jgi:EpsD family peptidyl-prolyl cis-trans isomerase